MVRSIMNDLKQVKQLFNFNAGNDIRSGITGKRSNEQESGRPKNARAVNPFWGSKKHNVKSHEDRKMNYSKEKDKAALCSPPLAE